jgi:hypothetical protein
MRSKLVVNSVIRCVGMVCGLRYKKIVLTLSVALLLAACGTSPQEVVIRDVTDPSHAGASKKMETVNKSYNIEKQEKKKAITRESIASEIQPVYSASARQQSPLKDKILLSAQNKLAANNPQGAIVLAEKGLRIDRKDSQFYIVLADAYARVDNKKQSSYFAQQGLRYAQKNSQEYRALQRWLD